MHLELVSQHMAMFAFRYGGVERESCKGSADNIENGAEFNQSRWTKIKSAEMSDYDHNRVNCGLEETFSQQ